jgi:hypothetical protein
MYTGRWETFTQPNATFITTTCSIDGTYNQTAGRHVINGVLQIGSNTYANGNYILSDGILDASGATGTNGSEIIAYGGTSTEAYFKQSGGTNLSGVLVVSGGGNGEYDQTGGLNSPAELRLGVAISSEGIYNLSGSGTLNVIGSEYVGYSYRVFYYRFSKMYQSGGAHLVGGDLLLSGEFDLSGSASLSVGGIESLTSPSGVGQFFQTGGSNQTSSGLRILAGIETLQPYTQRASCYVLSGGTLSSPSTTNHGSFIQIARRRHVRL